MTQKERTVHFSSSQQINSDVTEESENEDHEPSSSNDQYLTNVSSSAIKSGGDMHSASSISTSILDDAEEVKELKNKLTEIEGKCKLLEITNEKVNIDFNNEKNKNAKLEKKLQFVKDNQEVFMRLKEAYINMKYNEAAGRKMIEVREKSVQTWEGIICRACIETEELRRKMESLKETYNNSVIVSPEEIEQLINTANYLSDLVARREKSWTTYVDRVYQLESQLTILQNENDTLKSVLKTQQVIAEEKPAVDPSSSEPYNELTQLKKIIIKYEKRFKEIKKNQEGIICPSLNDKERKVVYQLMAKYNSRLHRNKSRSLSRERVPELRTSQGRVRSKSGGRLMEDNKSSPDRFQTGNHNADVTIQMMDYLFESCTQ